MAKPLMGFIGLNGLVTANNNALLSVNLFILGQKWRQDYGSVLVNDSKKQRKYYFH